MTDDLREFRQCPRCGLKHAVDVTMCYPSCGYRVRRLDNIEPIPARLQAAVIGMFLCAREVRNGSDMPRHG